MVNTRKRARLSPDYKKKSDPFENLPDDLVICILTKLCSSASCPSDFINALLVCKRFNNLGVTQYVLKQASTGILAIKPKNWSESAHFFLKQCVYSGNIEACYFLGMIKFYCLQQREAGTSLLAKAAIRSHAPSLYSLAVIQFNGSGGSKGDKDLPAGVALCARAASLGCVAALRELGHCLQDGYGVKQNITEGRRLLLQANARELAAVLPPGTLSSLAAAQKNGPKTRKKLTALLGPGRAAGLLSDFGCAGIPAPDPGPAARFMTGWFRVKDDNGLGLSLGPGLRMCSNAGCGRPETRAHEFRRCSVCGVANYCSRACQAMDWRLGHQRQCSPAAADHGGNVDPGVLHDHDHQGRDT